MGIASVVLLLICTYIFLWETQAKAEAVHESTNTTTTSLTLPLLMKKMSRIGNKTEAEQEKLVRMHAWYGRQALFVRLSVGTPPQRQWFVLDTASELSWLHCSSSSSSSSSPGSFHARQSSTYKSVPCRSALCSVKAADLPIPTSCGGIGRKVCRFAQTYADGTSVEGDIATDVFAVGAGVHVAFGCTGTAVPGTPGLLGLNKGELSLVSQVGATKFSMCVTTGAAGGVLTIGDTDTAVAGRLRYTPMVSAAGSSVWRPPNFDRGAYSVRLEGIKVGATRLPIPKSVFVPDGTGAGQTMLDSATQFSLLLGDAYAPLRAEFVRQNARALGSPLPGFVYGGALDLCFSDPPAPAAATPVTLQLQSVDIVLDAQRVLFRLPRRRRPSVWCLSFGNADLVALDSNIIGNHHQQGLWFEFDLAHARVGIASSSGPCSSSSKKLSPRKP